MIVRPCARFFVTGMFIFLALLGCGKSDGAGSTDAGLADGGNSQSALDHPRLFFSKGDIQTLKTKAQTTHLEIWRPIQSRADAVVAAGVPVFPDPEAIAFQTFGDDIQAVALAYVITDNVVYLDFAVAAMEAFSTWPAWGAWDNSYEVRDFGLQYMLRGNAYALDWLWHHIQPADRDRLVAALAQKTLEMYEAATLPYNADWQNWWRTAVHHNHWSSNLAAMGLAALVLEGEVVEAAHWLDYAKTQLAIRADIWAGINDGTWHEGMQYQNADLFFVLPFLENIRRNHQLDLVPREYMENYVLWKLHNYVPGTLHSVLTYGDYAASWGGGYGWGGRIVLNYIAGRYQNATAAWLDETLLPLEPWGRLPDDAPFWICEFFYQNPQVTGQFPNNVANDAFFPDQGALIWRTGFDQTDLAFGLRASAYGGQYLKTAFGDAVSPSHEHADAPSFYLYKGAAELSAELADPFIQDSHQTTWHNTVVVNDTNQFISGWEQMEPNVDPVITENVVLEHYNYVAVDVTNRYKTPQDDGVGPPQLERFERRVVFDKSGYIVIVDDITHTQPAQFSWFAHFGENQLLSEMAVENSWVKGPDVAGDLLGIVIAAPIDAQISLGENTTRFTQVTKPFLKARPAAENVDSVRFNGVLLPMASTNWNQRPQVEALENQSALLTTVTWTDHTDKHLFNFVSDSQSTLDQIQTDAQQVSIRLDADGRVTRYFIVKGSFLEVNGEVLLSVDTPITQEEIF